MASISSIDQVDQTIRIYDNFYNKQLTINAADYDIVYSYFKGKSNNADIASNMTTILFRIAQTGNYNVMDLLEIVQGAPNNLQMNTILCYYLNTFKSNNSLYGVGNIPKPNEAVQRNVVQ
jgi:hypothetical protein